jgi:hypothetical protein
MKDFDVVALIDCSIMNIREVFGVDFECYWQDGLGETAITPTVTVDGIEVRFSQELYSKDISTNILMDYQAYDDSCIIALNTILEKLNLMELDWIKPIETE